MSSGFYAWKQGRERWELESTLLFMMTSVLKSRTEIGLESNADYYDEDVNVYLAGLLSAYLDPAYTEWSAPLISRFDTDLAVRVSGSREREKYWIYKVNADHLMVTLGIFEPQLGEGNPAQEPAGEPGGAPNDAQARRRVYLGRGGAYYELAASYGRTLARRATASIEVLEKLAHGFEAYVAILNYTRSHYFNLIDRFSQRGMQAIQEAIGDQARSAELRAKVDALLDLYSQWLASGDPGLEPLIRSVLAEIRTLDPEFAFDFPG